MPESIDVGQTTPGNHPDAAPGNAMERNTAALGNVANEVSSHRSAMSDHVAAMRGHTGAMESHRAVMEAHTEKTSESIEAMAGLLQSITTLTAGLKELQTEMAGLVAHLTDQHTPNIRENTEAIKSNSTQIRNAGRC